MTNQLRARFEPKPQEPHRFTPDSDDYGYRAHCRICHRMREDHPYFPSPILPRPRKPEHE